MAMDHEMQRMQREAIHRVNEMQARAKQRVHGDGPREPEKPANKPEAISPAVSEEPASQLTGLFDALMEDRERTMILLLILLLFTEGADTSTVFALLYTVL